MFKVFTAMLKCWGTGAKLVDDPGCLARKLGAVHRWRFSPCTARDMVMVCDTKPAVRPSGSGVAILRLYGGGATTVMSQDDVLGVII